MVKAEVCKTSLAGSIPARGSIFFCEQLVNNFFFDNWHAACRTRHATCRELIRSLWITFFKKPLDRWVFVCYIIVVLWEVKGRSESLSPRYTLPATTLRLTIYNYCSVWTNRIWSTEQGQLWGWVPRHNLKQWPLKLNLRIANSAGIKLWCCSRTTAFACPAFRASLSCRKVSLGSSSQIR